MTEEILGLVPVWGLWLVAAVTFLSCLALPVPASLVMMAAGAFAAAGDLVLWQAAAAAFGGAVAGDHTGFLAGRHGGARLVAWIGRHRDGAAALARASAWLELRGTVAVFLSRWLFSPLGPYVNFAGGAAGLGWRRFAAGCLAGEAVWVVLYVGLGFAYAGQIEMLRIVLGNVSGALAAGLVTLTCRIGCGTFFGR